MKPRYPTGWAGQLAIIVVGALTLGLVTGLGYVALTSRTPEPDVALPDRGKVSASPTPSPSSSASATASASPSPSPTAAATASASATATAAATVVASPTGTASGSASAAPDPIADPPATAAAAPRTISKVSARLFGVHDANPVGGGWPNAPVRSLRVWDTGDTWRQIEPSPGKFDFTHLDAVVSTAEANGADSLIVLGQTPGFHATNPKADSFYGAGASSMPKMAAWKNYVAKVGSRYRGRAVSFQVWNEANVVGFWSGTPQQMAQLTKAAHDVLTRVNPKATLVAPALVTRLSGQRSWLNKFYAQRVGGRPVAAWVDVVSLQLYPMATGTPEDSMALLGVNRGILARYGVRKPIWNTEVNYGMTGKPVSLLPESQQAAYVARTYLLNAANGVNRVYWYGWEIQTIVSTRMVSSDLSSLTSGGVAFSAVADWMRGTRIDWCPVDANGTYTCTLTKGTEVRRVYWNPSRSASVQTPAGTTTVHKLDGSNSALTGGSTLQVDSVPVMVK